MDKPKQSSTIGNLFSRLGILPTFKQLPGEEEIMQEFEQLMMSFRKRILELNFRWARIIRYYDLLANPETQKGYHKKWIALRLTSGLYGKLKENIQVYHSSKQEFVAKITELYPELGEKIRSLKESSGQNEVLAILSPIVKIKNNPQLVESYIITHYDEIMQRVDSMKYTKTANELRHPIVVLSNMEVKELDRCVKDVRSWPYRGTYGMPLFIERGFLYINGGRSRYDKEGFLGFNMKFRDEKLVRELRSSPEVRRLMTYQKEIEFFNRMSSAIRESVRTQGKWEGFYAFYNNLDKGHNYIRVVREDFGNENFARILEVFKEKKHEMPEGWAEELSELSNTLISRAYQLVIEPAGNAFIRIFDSAAKRLEKEKQIAMSGLIALMAKDDGTEELKRQFITLIKKTRTRLINEFEKERSEFETLVQRVVLKMPKMDSLFLSALNTSDSENQTKDMLKIFGRYVQWGEFGLAHLRILERPESALENDNTVRAITAAVAAVQKEAVLASQGLKRKKRIFEKSRAGYEMLTEANKILEEEIATVLSKCEAYLGIKLGNYTDNVSYYLSGTWQQPASNYKIN